MKRGDSLWRLRAKASDFSTKGLIDFYLATEELYVFMRAPVPLHLANRDSNTIQVKVISTTSRRTRTVSSLTDRHRASWDRTHSRERAGSSDLFAAVARARPRLHCFGHIHEGWGAKLVAWRENASEQPSNLTDIDNERSVTVETLGTIRRSNFDTDETAADKAAKAHAYAEKGCCETSHCHGDERPVSLGRETLFVNASIKGDDELDIHFPWLITLDLAKREGD